jgi:putative ABC transport system permease protein
LDKFGVKVVAGQPYTPTATDQIMLGYRAARDLNKSVGDTVTIERNTFRVVGIFSTGQVFGDSASMLPLQTLQGLERKPGNVTLIFVKVKPGTDIQTLRTKIDADNPEMATVVTESEFGRIDRNLKLISAANVGASILALVIGAIGVMNTTVMSVFERTREIGILRSIGMLRRQVSRVVVIESMLLGIIGGALGAGAGIIIGWMSLEGFLKADYGASMQYHINYSSIAWALALSTLLAALAGVYPARRAAKTNIVEALAYE